MSDSPAAVTRAVEIAPQSARDELVTVVRLGVAVVFGMWLYLANQSGGDVGVARKSLLPYQSVVLDRPPEEQRMFRALQVGLLEAENIRSTSGAWPTVDALAAEGIEPFAPDPTNRGAQYRWQLYRDAFRLGYVGVPDRPDALVWLLFIQEPDPSLPPEPYQNDEEHHKLIDGLVLHVSTWTRSLSRGDPTMLPRSPQGEGWSQLFAVGPSATHEKTSSMRSTSSLPRRRRRPDYVADELESRREEVTARIVDLRRHHDVLGKGRGNSRARKRRGAR